MTNDGILAIWHDVEAAVGGDYERWYFREHLPERLGVPGFLAGRRYEAVTGAPRFPTCHEAKAPDAREEEARRAAETAGRADGAEAGGYRLRCEVGNG